jgi:hypothetical protein
LAGSQNNRKQKERRRIVKSRPIIPDISDLNDLAQIPTNKSGGGIVMEPTMNLRVYVYMDGDRQKHKIQQEWRGVGREGVYEKKWKDLPVVHENGAA